MVQESKKFPLGIGIISGIYFLLSLTFIITAFLMFILADGVSVGQSTTGGVMAADTQSNERVYYPVNTPQTGDDVKEVLKNELSGEIDDISKDVAKNVGKELILNPASEILKSLSSIIIGFMGLTVLLLGVTYCAIGAGLLYGKKWARIIVILLSIMSILTEIPVLLLGMYWSAGFIIIANSTIIAYLSLRKNAKEMF